MVTRKRTKHGARSGAPVKQRVLLEEGDWLDVMDGDGVWNVARVLSVPSPAEVEITYDGWQGEYDEVVRIDSDRVAPYHTFTWAVKCWVKYLNWPLWPSLITIRTPGTPEGIRSLAAEHRLYVDFLDSPYFDRRDRCWQKRAQVRIFEDNYNKKRTASTGEHFERSLGWVLQSDASTKMPKFAVGTLPMEYKFSPTESVEVTRRNMGDEVWFQNFTLNRMRHQQNHVYESIGGEDEDASSDSSAPSTLHERWLNLSAMKEEPQTVTNDKNRPPPATTELAPPLEVEVPYELEPMDSSDGSGAGGEIENNRPKRRRLQTKRRSDGLSRPREVEQIERRHSASPRQSIARKPSARQVRNDGSSRSKGRGKLAARRSIPPLVGLLNVITSDGPVKIRLSGSFSDEDASEEAHSVPIVQQLGDRLPERSTGNVGATDTDDFFIVGSSIAHSRRVIERQIADAEEKLQALVEEKELASAQSSSRQPVLLNGPSPSSTGVHGVPQPISPCVDKIESHRSVQSNPELSRKAGKQNSPSSFEEKMTGASAHSMGLDHSLLSASKTDSSDAEEAKDTSAKSVQNNIEENGSTGKSDAKDSAVVVISDEQTYPDFLDADTNDNGEDDGSQSHQRFCAMQADIEETPVDNATNKVSSSKKTVISVPRKCDATSAPNVPACCTNSILRISPPPHLCPPTSSVRGAALASPSTAVFSSSKEFSMGSWFKRKLMAEFMGGGEKNKSAYQSSTTLACGAMALKQKTKRSPSSRNASPRQRVVLTEGDWLDVMDHDGVWNVARVLSVPSPEEVEVMYDGWPEEYDEVVRVDSHRVAPYHTFTWAVKCWVKYLNWPLWPSVITIRTPGTAEGSKNLAMESRLYVDFLDEPDFAQRDRYCDCGGVILSVWSWTKRQVKMFDDKYDKNRKGTNGAQFEHALASILQSDSTTKMPTFARGTLPLQYKHATTDSVERMRRNMGKELWYRNFANNKERHKQTHVYEDIMDDKEDAASDESVPLPKLRVRRPKTSAANDEQTSPPKKKRVLLPVKRQPVVVKIEQDPLAEVEVPYELEEKESSDDHIEREREAPHNKKRRLQVRKRSVASPAKSKAMFKKEEHLTSSQDTNAAAAMPRHVTVMMDEIIVDDDDDSESSGVDRRKVTRTASRKSRASNIPAHVKEESGGADNFNLLALSDSEARVDIDAIQATRKAKVTTKRETAGRVRQRVRRKKSEPSANLHHKAWNGIFSELAESATKRSKRNGEGFCSYLSLSDKESDGIDYSDGFDPGTSSEDKAASPFDLQLRSQDNAMGSHAGAQAGYAASLKVKASSKGTPSGAPVRLGLTKESSADAGQTKMAARRSIPPLKKDPGLAASPKPRSYIRFSLSVSEEDDWEDEEKGVLRDAVKEVEQYKLAPKKSGTKRQPKQSGDSKQGKGSRDATAPHIPRPKMPARWTKTPLPLIEQRISFAQEVLRDLETEKQEVAKGSAPKEQQKRSSPSSLSGSHNGNPTVLPREKTAMPRSYQAERSDLSFLRVDDKESRLSVSPGLAGDREGEFAELDLGFHSSQLGHSFLSVVEAYSSDGQESKGIPTPFDEDIGTNMESDPKEAKCIKRAEAKSLAEEKIVASVKHLAEEKANDDDDDDGEEKSQDVRRHFCVMQAGLEGALEIDEGENAKARTSKKTVISVPRKFDATVKEVPHAFTSSTDSIAPPPPLSHLDSDNRFNVALTPPSTAVFSSSEGFAMETWFKRTLTGELGNSKALRAWGHSQEREKRMRSHNDEEEDCKRPLYTVRQPPLIQPLRLSAFTQKTCSQFGIPSEDLAHEWVVLFQAISGGKLGDGMPLQIPDTVLLSPSGQPSVWYTTSSAGRVKAKDLMRVSPQAILEAFVTPLPSQRHLSASAGDIIAVRRLGFEVASLSRQQLTRYGGPQHLPPPGVELQICALRDDQSKPADSNSRTTHSGGHGGTVDPSRKSNDTSKRSTPRAYSDVFLLALPNMDGERAGNDPIKDNVVVNETPQQMLQGDHRLSHLDIVHPDGCTWKTLRRGGFDPDVMAPLLFYMKRVTSEIANSVNLGHNTRQACGLACEFFVGEYNRSVYFSGLRGIQWVASAPSWELLRDVDPLSRSLCEFYGSDVSTPGLSESRARRSGPSSPQRPRSPLASDRTMYYEQNPRFPSVHTPFVSAKQWLHRSQLLAPDISPRYVGASVPKIYRDGVFQSLLTAHQADSVVRLNLSPQAPATLAEVRREQSHLSPRKSFVPAKGGKKYSSR
ncbi:hypothetical protein PHYPSEUDO_007197 [Phytophthora pseudosyringae]|uniref:PWWP domain-containing protein n=1 Tax=Phytophthora pseudosyringae TaxID=221518 RepID=A0A8T1VM36_9STRA|nr:hypothetical protein PHYPSEUDO_007197 [Phytophthora pseudosyringae]